MGQSTELGDWLTQYRKAKNPKISQAEVAERAGVTRQFYGGIETGRFRVGRGSAERIAQVLGMDDPDTTKMLTLAGYMPRPPKPVIVDLGTGRAVMTDGTEANLALSELRGIRGNTDDALLSIEQRLIRIEALLTQVLAMVDPAISNEAPH